MQHKEKFNTSKSENYKQTTKLKESLNQQCESEKDALKDQLSEESNTEKEELGK